MDFSTKGYPAGNGVTAGEGNKVDTVPQEDDVTARWLLNSSNSLPTTSDKYMSFATFQLIQILTNCGFNTLLLVLGVPANALSCAVFYRQGLRDRMNFCLFCLAIVDGLYLCTVFMVGAHCMVSQIDQKAGSILSVYGRYYLTIFSEGLMHCSALITVIISVERCLCVVFPMKAATIMKTRTMAGIILLSCVLAQLLCCSAFVKRGVEVEYHPDTGKAMPKVSLGDVYLRFPEVFDGISFFVSVLLKLITFVVVSISTAVTVYTLQRAIAWREAASSSTSEKQTSRAQLALVKMLVVVSAIYVACAVPSVVVTAVRSLVADFQVWGPYPYTVMSSLMMAQVPHQAKQHGQPRRLHDQVVPFPTRSGGAAAMCGDGLPSLLEKGNGRRVNPVLKPEGGVPCCRA